MRVPAVLCPAHDCLACGWEPKKRAEYRNVRDEQLVLIDRAGRSRAREHSKQDRDTWHAMFAHIAAARGYKPGWASYQYKEKFGAWPWGSNPVPVEPSLEVLAWVRHKFIAYAKAKEKEAREQGEAA